MRVDPLTKCLLAVATGSLALIALRPASPSATAAAAAAQEVAAPAGAAQSGSRADVARLQISATPNGFLAFDASTGEVLRVTAGSEKMETLGTLRKGAGGKWEFGGAKPNGGPPPADAAAEGARLVTAQAEVAKVMSALRDFKRDTGRFPSTEEGLQALIVQPTSVDNWKGPYMKDGLPKDPWGNPYIYREPGKLNADGVDVLSFGPDLRDGGGDDIFGR